MTELINTKKQKYSREGKIQKLEAWLVNVVVLDKAILCNSATCERGIMHRNNLISGNGTISTGLITAISGLSGQQL